jgi:3-deoxy-manno-octulosonate cytidylyltransferase (CMP-KDO synthetase)
MNSAATLARMTALASHPTTRPPRARVCIPARWAATRLPGKLLRRWGERSVLERTAAIAIESGLGPVTILAGDPRIEAAARTIADVEVIRVEGPARNGTERIAAALQAGLLGTPELLVNLQGDAVGAEPGLLRAAVDALLLDPAVGLATVAVPAPIAEAGGRTTVAVADGLALDFSRSPLPDGAGATLLHVGIYAYRAATLLEVAAAPPSPREQAESLEQLRWLEQGRPIAVALHDGAPRLAHAIDTAQDLDRHRADPAIDGVPLAR